MRRRKEEREGIVGGRKEEREGIVGGRKEEREGIVGGRKEEREGIVGVLSKNLKTQSVGAFVLDEKVGFHYLSHSLHTIANAR